MITVSRTFSFEAAHRLRHHDGACRNIHGHSYRVAVTLRGPQIKGGSSDGMVMDFRTLKSIMSQILFEGSMDTPPLDHSIILAAEDELFEILNKFSEREGLRIVALDYEPTAENMARWIGLEIEEQLAELNLGDVKVSNIMLFETADSWASWVPND